MASASLEAPTAPAANPTSPVPLDTIPISPADGKNDQENAAANGNSNGGSKSYKDTDQVTVFHDADNFNVKHPLMHKWTLWFTKPPSGKVLRKALTQDPSIRD